MPRVKDRVAVAGQSNESAIALVRERVRGGIALGLIAVLALVVLLAVAGVLLGRVSMAELRDLFSSMGVLTTLVGTAMGFYFGRVSTGPRDR